MEYSVMLPCKSLRPILFPVLSVNQSAESGPATMPIAVAFAVGIGYSVMSPASVIRPILLPRLSVNHIARSGPYVMQYGREKNDGIANSLNRRNANVKLARSCSRPLR